MDKNAKHICNCVIAGGCDLHMHTTYSDGSDSVTSLIQKVIQNELKCFSVTDHDCIDAIDEVFSLLKKIRELGFKTPEFIPGIEISAELGEEIHILGYFPDGGFEKIQEFVLLQREQRNIRNEKMCECLTKMGMPITIEELNAEGERSIGRRHAANVLIRKGYISSASQGFNEIFGYGKPCYVKRKKPTAKEAINAIKKAGGVPVLAHPFLYGWTGAVDGVVSQKLIDSILELKTLGMEGVEAFHGEATSMQREEIFAASVICDLFLSAGSDYHGTNKDKVKMYTGDKKFLDEKVCNQGVAIIKIGEKFIVEEMSGLEGFGRGIRFPGIYEQDLYGKRMTTALQEFVYENISENFLMKERYITTFDYSEEKREILSAYFFEEQNLSEKINSSNINFKLMNLQEISNNTNLKSHAKIVSKLREISLFD